MKHNIKINQCPLCKNDYKHLLTHIRNKAQDNNEYQQLLNQQCIIAQQLYNDLNYNSITYDNYNLLLNYLEYASLWYNELQLPKRINNTPNTTTFNICPFCNKKISSSTFNTHLRIHHIDEFDKQIQLIKQLFYDIKFCEATLKDYPEIYVNINTVYKIWKQYYSLEERKNRGKQCNAYRVSCSNKGKRISDEQKLKLSEIHKKRRITQNLSQAFAIRGIRPDIGHFAASHFEANIYRIFQYENKKYNYKTDNVFRIVLPNQDIHKFFIEIQDVDGLLVSPGAYIKIKMVMNKEISTNIDCFKRQYPQYQLFTLGRQINSPVAYKFDIDYNLLEQQYQSKIPLWETDEDNIQTNPTKWNII